MLASITCCSDDREIIYSGFNDLVVGSQSLILYNDKTFYLELSLGGTEGNYNIKKDTIILSYNEKPSNSWPDRILIEKDYFSSLEGAYLKIERHK